MGINSKSTFIIYFLLVTTTLCFQTKPAQALEAGEISQQAQQMITDALSASAEEMSTRAGEIGETVSGAAQVVADHMETIGEAVSYLAQIGNAWTDETWNHFMNIFKQAGVAVDELIPSISGCIVDDQGRPMRGVLVAMIPTVGDNESDEYLAMLPSFAITGNGTIEQHPGNHSSFGFSAGLPGLPVSDSILPESYRTKFNQGGCYLVPVPPSLMRAYFKGIQAWVNFENDTADSLGVPQDTSGRRELSFAAIIHPMFPGYNMGPYEQKIVFKAGGQVEITNVDSGETRTVRAQ